MNATKLAILCFLAPCAVACVISTTAPAQTEDAEKILFVGNSYTAGIRSAHDAMLKQQGIKAQVDYVAPGGKTLDWHVKNGTLDKIRQGKYDLVILQEQSQTPAYKGLQEKFFAACKTAAKEIKQNGGTPVLYMTWGRRDGDQQNRKLAPTFEKMQSLLTASYRQAGRENNAKVVPVGEVWAAIRRADLDLAKRMYRRDGSHPSPLGAYVTALTFTSHLFNRKPADVPPSSSVKVSSRELEIIQKAVNATIRQVDQGQSDQ